MDINKIIARVKAILLTPKTEWPVITTEPTTVADLYKGYIIPLAAIPALMGFLSMSIIGIRLPFAGTVRIGVMSGLTSAIVQYVLSLVMIYVMAVIVEALAPTFSAQKDRVQALKAVAYAATATWVASIGQIVPWLGTLIALAGLVYTVYLLYLGLPHTMKCPEDKSAGYTALSILIAIIIGFIINMVVVSVSGVGTMMAGSTLSSTSNDVQFDKDSPIGKLEQWSKNVEAAGKNLEEAQKSGDQKAQGDALAKMMGAALGGGQVQSLPTDRLKPLVPESLNGLQRRDFSVERNNVLGLQISEARASYAGEDGREVNLQITDAGSAKGILALADWAGLEEEKETSTGYEKTYREGGRLVHEQWDKSSSHGEYAVVIADRFTVQVSGRADGIDDLKSALGNVDLNALESMKNEGVVSQ